MHSSEDNDIRRLFEGFQPQLPSDSLFMAKLEKEMKAVEFIKQQNMAYKNMVRKAAVIAASVGFIVGLLLSLTVHLMGTLISNFNLDIPVVRSSYDFTINLQLLVWIAIGGLTVFSALSAYELSLVRLKSKNSMRRPSL